MTKYEQDMQLSRLAASRATIKFMEQLRGAFPEIDEFTQPETSVVSIWDIESARRADDMFLNREY